MDVSVYSKSIVISGDLICKGLALYEKKRQEIENFLIKYLVSLYTPEIVISGYTSSRNKYTFIFLVRLKTRTKVYLPTFPTDMGNNVTLTTTRNLIKDYYGLQTTHEFVRIILGSENQLLALLKPEKTESDEVNFTPENILSYIQQLFVEYEEKMSITVKEGFKVLEDKQNAIEEKLLMMFEKQEDRIIDLVRRNSNDILKMIKEDLDSSFGIEKKEIKDVKETQQVLLEKLSKIYKNLLKKTSEEMDNVKDLIKKDIRELKIDIPQQLDVILREKNIDNKENIDSILKKLLTLEVKQETQFDKLYESIKNTKEILKYSGKYNANKTLASSMDSLQIKNQFDLKDKIDQINGLSQKLEGKTNSVNSLTEELSKKDYQLMKTQEELMKNKEKIKSLEDNILIQEQKSNEERLKIFIENSIDKTIENFANFLKESNQMNSPLSLDQAYNDIYMHVTKLMEQNQLNVNSNYLYEILDPYLRKKLELFYNKYIVVENHTTVPAITTNYH